VQVPSFPGSRKKNNTGLFFPIIFLSIRNHMFIFSDLCFILCRYTYIFSVLLQDKQHTIISVAYWHWNYNVCVCTRKKERNYFTIRVFRWMLSYSIEHQNIRNKCEMCTDTLCISFVFISNQLINTLSISTMSIYMGQSKQHCAQCCQSLWIVHFFCLFGFL
jgi:hypothetical protein